MSGWIALYRSFENHWLNNFDEPDKALAWINLLLMANHKDKKINIKGRVIECKRGQLACSQVTLQKKFKMSQNKLKRFLVLLQNEGMIEIEANELTTVITICNYNSFQESDREDGRAGERTDGRADGRATNEQNVKNAQKTDEQKIDLNGCNYNSFQESDREDGRAGERTGNQLLKKNARKTDEQTDDNITNKQITNNKTININTSSFLGFAEFWQAYPKKKSKADAMKAWAKLNPDERLQAEIIKAVMLAKTQDDWLKNGGQYVPHPATYLNGKRWEDEIMQTPLTRGTNEARQQSGYTSRREHANRIGGHLDKIINEEFGQGVDIRPF